MRYTSYREIEQQAQIAVTNAEKRRDDISEQDDLCFVFGDSRICFFSGSHSSSKSDADGFVWKCFSPCFDLKFSLS